ncbi:class I SAM-dependent methyltransferase [Patescibacteria group bacterium AH-259-L05]|nr:class I SAM-dependent methyltransferase [Patescibacteria group bacterium AH-259-L05]
MKTAKEARAHYNALHNYELGSRLEGWHVPRLTVENVEPYLKGGEFILDVGSGPGEIGVELENVGWSGTLIGVDIAELRLKQADDKTMYTACMHMDAYSLGFSDSVFDVVVSSGMVGLTGIESIKEMYRVVKHGGYLVCAVAEIKSLAWCRQRFKNALHYFDNSFQAQLLCRKDLGGGYTSEYNDEHFVLYLFRRI